MNMYEQTMEQIKTCITVDGKPITAKQYTYSNEDKTIEIHSCEGQEVIVKGFSTGHFVESHRVTFVECSNCSIDYSHCITVTQCTHCRLLMCSKGSFSKNITCVFNYCGGHFADNMCGRIHEPLCDSTYDGNNLVVHCIFGATRLTQPPAVAFIAGSDEALTASVVLPGYIKIGDELHTFRVWKYKYKKFFKRMGIPESKYEAGEAVLYYLEELAKIRDWYRRENRTWKQWLLDILLLDTYTRL